MRFSLDTYTSLGETRIEDILFPLVDGDRIFFRGDLGSGKSTFVRALLREHLQKKDLIVRSPTYTYYQKYGYNIYHFDLYRMESIDDLLLTGAVDIFDDPTSICLIEWPEILGDSLVPTRTLDIEIDSEGTRTYTIKTSL